jgi:hypothetical protein
MLNSLPAPSLTPEVSTTAPNYNALSSQFEEAKATLSNTPILGTSINQHIAQQQALGEQGAKVDLQEIQQLATMENSALEQAAKNEYQNALKRHQDAESRRIFDMGIRQQIQDNMDAAIAVKTDAAKKVGQELYSLHKLQELRDNIKKMNALRQSYTKEKERGLSSKEDAYNLVLENEFRDEFTKLYELEDTEQFDEKYGINRDDYDRNLAKILDSDEYKAKLEEYKKSKEADWITQRNDFLTDFDKI